jgi:heptose I phosphotransferase
LTSLGLVSLAQVKACRGELIKDHKGRRDVLRLEARDAQGRPLILFLKRIWQQDRKDGLYSLFRHGRVWSVSRREWDNALVLQAAGIRTSELVAYGEECGLLWEHFSFLLTQAVPASQTLDDFIRQCHDPTLRRKVIGSLAKEIARLHNSGLASPDLFCRHLFVDISSAEPVFYWIDMSRLDQRSTISPKLRARDLAALNLTAPLRLVSLRERLRFLKLYAGTVDRPLIRRIQKRMKHLLKRRKFQDFLRRTEPKAKPRSPTQV